MRCRDAHSRKIARKQSQVRYSHILSAGEAVEAEEVAVSAFHSCSLSLVAAHGVSGQRFQAPTRWLPDFQSLAPAQRKRRRTRY